MKKYAYLNIVMFLFLSVINGQNGNLKYEKDFDKAEKIKEQNAKLKSFREEQDEKVKKAVDKLAEGKRPN